MVNFLYITLCCATSIHPLILPSMRAIARATARVIGIAGGSLYRGNCRGFFPRSHPNSWYCARGSYHNLTRLNFRRKFACIAGTYRYRPCSRLRNRPRRYRLRRFRPCRYHPRRYRPHSRCDVADFKGSTLLLRRPNS